MTQRQRPNNGVWEFVLTQFNDIQIREISGKSVACFRRLQRLLDHLFQGNLNNKITDVNDRPYQETNSFFGGMLGSFNSSQINACIVGIGVLGPRFIVSSVVPKDQGCTKCCPRGDSNPAYPACQASAVPLGYSSPCLNLILYLKLHGQFGLY